MPYTNTSLPETAFAPLPDKNAYAADKFDIALLGRAFSPEIERILQSVQAAQFEDQKHFIKPQSLRDLFRHHALGLPVIGSIEKETGKVAGLLLVTPTASIYPNTPLAKYPTLTMESDTAIIGSVATRPGYRGMMQPLLQAAESHAAAMGLLGVWAKVSVENAASNHGFEKAGWSRKVHGTDPDQGYKVSYWRKSLDGVAPVALPVFNEAHDERRSASIYPFAAPERR